MDEGHQLRVVGRVRPSVGCDPVDAPVHPVHLGHGGLRLGHRAERGGADEGSGASQAPERVLLVARVLRHAGHGQGVESLEQQRAHPADEHRRQIGVDLAGDAVGRQIRRPPDQWRSGRARR